MTVLNKVTISIDAMGGDHGPEVTVPAALKTLKQHKNLQLILVGLSEVLQPMVPRRLSDRVIIHHASEQVAMDELPSKALRTKKDSSMRVAINLVKEGAAQACVSAGNTGALMATARYVLKTIPGVDRPAIVTSLPTIFPDKEVHMLDLGANIDSCADHLYQFAIMGSVLVQAVEDIERPRVGLLNIGEEEIKGNDLVKHTASLLEKSEHINYVGYVEGNDIFKGEVDLVVCDGFVGNIALKTIEGVAKLIAKYVKRAFCYNFLTKAVAVIAWPILKMIKHDIDPGKRNGASLLGLQGIVIKSHGSAAAAAFAVAIEEAILEVEKNVPQRISDEVSAMLEEADSL